MEPKRYGRPAIVMLPYTVAKALDKLVKSGHFAYRSEAAQYLITRTAVDFAFHIQSINPKRSERREQNGRKRPLPDLAIRVTQTILDLLDLLIEEGYFVSRSEAARYFILTGAIRLIESMHAFMREGDKMDVR
jgi:Arc/MetJ-type ribon-helix-helix transcriptional regulator